MSEHLSTALQMAPLVERVHGPSHSELTRVRELTQAIAQSPNLATTLDLFAELRVVTDNYGLPSDACEVYTGTYQALQAAEEELINV